MAGRYTKAEKNLIKQLTGHGRTPAQISAALKQQGYARSGHQISNFLHYEARKPQRPKPAMSVKHKQAINTLNDLRAKMEDVTKTHFTTSAQTEGTDTKILVLTDLHIPFEHEGVVGHALGHHADADVLVIGGDMIEGYCVSHFQQSKTIMFRWEYEAALEYIKILSAMFPTVVLVSGNHERRLARYVSDNLGSMLRGLVHDDPLAALAGGMAYNAAGRLEKMHDFPNVIYDATPRGDYAKIGKLIVAHPNNYSTVPMRTAVTVAEALLGAEDFQCLITGHTHAQGRLIWRDRLLIEAGCCCVPLDYTFASGRLAKFPQTFGYVVAFLDKEGNVNFNETRSVYRGIGKIVKTETFDPIK